MKKIIIIGSGPVGSFMALLCCIRGYIVTVYEKRTEFTRNINLKIEHNFFKEVHEFLARLNIDNNFFEDLNSFLLSQNDKILIRDLESKLSSEAKSIGALYVNKEVKDFGELHKDHVVSNPIILDCTGRNSFLREKEFGADQENLITFPLQSAIYINFKAKTHGNLSLYQAMKYNKHIKLSEVVMSRQKDECGYTKVTIPVFITNELGGIFDEEFPEINRNPINPFTAPSPVQNTIFFPISSLLGNLIVDGSVIDLNSVTVKKIVISCGYARKRSKDNFICLGDSAAHLAFFKSLNLGLRHALELFVRLSIHQAERTDSRFAAMSQFKRDNPHLNPIKIYTTDGENVFMIVTRLVWFGCFSYCYTNRKTERLTNHLGVVESQIDSILQELNRKLNSWSYLLIEFESMRDRDFQHEIKGNMEKNVLYDFTSWFISLNGKSIIKSSEGTRALSGKYSLYKRDFEFISTLLERRRNVVSSFGTSESPATLLLMIILELLKQGDSSDLEELREVCTIDVLTSEQRIDLLSDRLERLRVRKNRFALVFNANVKAKFIFDLIRNEISAIPKIEAPLETRNMSRAQSREEAGRKMVLENEQVNLRENEDLITFGDNIDWEYFTNI